MSEGYEVKPDELRAHARSLRGFADRADTAASAGAHLSSIDGAYGVLCQPVATMMQEVEGYGAQELGKLEKLTGQAADDAAAAADTYERREQKVVDILNGIKRELEAIDIPRIDGANKGAC